MQSCPVCRAGGVTVHAGAHRLLHEALNVLVLHKSQREAYYGRVQQLRGEDAARDLLSVVNTIRAFDSRSS